MRSHFVFSPRLSFATLFLGLIGYYLLPTVPPWLASQEGHTATVVRIPKVFSEEVVSGSYESGAAVAGSNDVAAMPSLHTAVTVVIAVALARRGRLLGLLAWLYAASMAFALVYLGGHYLIDILAGWLLAVVVFKLVEARFLAAASQMRRLPAASAMPRAIRRKAA